MLAKTPPRPRLQLFSQARGARVARRESRKNWRQKYAGEVGAADTHGARNVVPPRRGTCRLLNSSVLAFSEVVLAMAATCCPESRQLRVVARAGGRKNPLRRIGIVNAVGSDHGARLIHVSQARYPLHTGSPRIRGIRVPSGVLGRRLASNQAYFP